MGEGPVAWCVFLGAVLHVLYVDVSIVYSLVVVLIARSGQDSFLFPFSGGPCSQK